MFSSKEKSSSAAASGTSLIAKGTEVIGELQFSGSLEVEGTIRGNVVAREGADKAQVRVQSSGEVIGDIVAPVVIINSRVEGNVYSSKRIELAANAVVCGDLHYQVIEMVKGAQVNGNMLFSPQQSNTAASDAAKSTAKPSNSDNTLGELAK